VTIAKVVTLRAQSGRIAVLLARFADVLATDPDVRIYTRTPYATTTEGEST
jgi:hypothetical protein